ncbi:protein of unknown function (plasmid) [Cupriavidus taiwanensis]|uniref:Uncharacterized protein n=1 Tax=Cupriavidus taiwanensis TaxID=164546 RepID=A0A375ISK1_9BURK|nr:protein of unknown function [Cupriavidus taiwanensis]
MHHLPDPDVIHRAWLCPEDLLPQGQLLRQQVLLLLRSLLAHLRERAGEVRAALATGAQVLLGGTASPRGTASTAEGFHPLMAVQGYEMNIGRDNFGFEAWRVRRVFPMDSCQRRFKI